MLKNASLVKISLLRNMFCVCLICLRHTQNMRWHCYHILQFLNGLWSGAIIVEISDRNKLIISAFGRLDCTSVCANNRKCSLIWRLSWEGHSMKFNSCKAARQVIYQPVAYYRYFACSFFFDVLSIITVELSNSEIGLHSPLWNNRTKRAVWSIQSTNCAIMLIWL